jgi:lambda repressor-like predicted transcriptional regulator
MPTSKADLFAAIRRDSRAGMSGRTIAQKYQVSRRTVRAALPSAWPQHRKPMPPRAVGAHVIDLGSAHVMGPTWAAAGGA